MYSLLYLSGNPSQNRVGKIIKRLGFFAYKYFCCFICCDLQEYYSVRKIRGVTNTYFFSDIPSGNNAFYLFWLKTKMPYQHHIIIALNISILLISVIWM